MFKKLFSFEGRIRRTEYGISFIITVVAYVTFLFIVPFLQVGLSSETPSFTSALISLLLPLAVVMPLWWFLLAQGAKRCHDIGYNGWWQLIPFFYFVLLFKEGEADANKYGVNPKGDQTKDLIDSIGE